MIVLLSAKVEQQEVPCRRKRAERSQTGHLQDDASYNEATLRQLQTVLSEKLTREGGTNLTELTNAVDGVYSFADDRRAGLIAESYRTAN